LQGEEENIKLIYYYSLKEGGQRKESTVKSLTDMTLELRLAQPESEGGQKR
jgi:hypothetical protein